MLKTIFFDKVVFEVRAEKSILLFTRENNLSQICDYLVITSKFFEENENQIIVEFNEKFVHASDLIKSASLSPSMLLLFFSKPLDLFQGATQIILIIKNSDENFKSMETGVFSLLGNKLICGNA